MDFSPSLGVRRRLDSCATVDGRFVMLAIDHRQNLRRALGDDATSDDLTAFKLEIIGALGAAASSVLVDPEYGAAQAVAAGAMAGARGMVVAVEATGYTADPRGRLSRVLDGWSVEQALHLGADAVKLLVYYHPDAASARAQEELVATVAQDCRRLDLPLFLEPLSYGLDGARLVGPELTRVVVDTARRLTAIGGDVLKAEFPAPAGERTSWTHALGQLDAASAIPWVILSGGVEFATFLDQARAAADAGSCGVMVGRAVWSEATRCGGPARTDFLATVATERLRALAAVGGPGWRDRAVAVPLPSSGWFR